jgi:hypothetical protein
MSRTRQQQEWAGRHVVVSVVFTKEEYGLIQQAIAKCHQQRIPGWFRQKGDYTAELQVAPFVQRAAISTANAME